ncbi:hypothetical protein [Nocardioides cavernaquae]|uniref:hypothetical protein n=1 Tax=Nocardioides cavernaquae TaxID=2321396 RepID=UPI00160442C5|nr:hypothetical protein [Nocardioides cavernaquae]
MREGPDDEQFTLLMRTEIAAGGQGWVPDVLSGQADGRWSATRPFARATLVWTVEAASHFEAMTLYWKRQGWGVNTTDFPDVDGQSYASRNWE